MSKVATRARGAGLLTTMLISVLLGPSMGAPLVAQQAGPSLSSLGFEPSADTPAPRPLLLASLPDSVVAQRDYRWEGLIIGAAALGLAAGALGHGLCSESETNNSHCIGNAIGGFIIGGIVGGTVGLFIGRAIPKRQ